MPNTIISRRYKWRYPLVCLLILLLSATTESDAAARTIHLAGLVINAQTLEPIADARLYDTKNHLLGMSDRNGYFNITLPCSTKNAIRFSIAVVKDGYQKFSDRENWGDLGTEVNKVMYLGITPANSKAEAFSSFPDASSGLPGLSYANVMSGFKSVQKKRQFENTLAQLKEGNEDVLLKVKDEWYVVDNGGWIQIRSDKDIISVNGTQEVEAGKINSIVKRKNVTSMTPLDSGKARFAIYTR